LEKDLLHICLEAIVRKVNDGQVEYWTDGIFIKLSEAIEEETSILISRNTLKRLFGKMKTPDDYKPQRETKNALAIFAGFKGWEDFKSKTLQENKELISSIPGYQPIANGKIENHADQIAKKYADEKRLVSKKSLGFGILILLAFAAFILIKRFSGHKILPKPEAEFTILNPIDTVPYTLKISYKTKNVSLDSLKIDNMPVFENTGRYNLGISVPIYTWVSIKHGKANLASKPYHAISKGWLAYFQHKRKKSFVHIQDESWKIKGAARLSRKWFLGKPLDSTDFFWNIRNFKNFDLDGDNFSVESKLKVEGDALGCSGILLNIFAEHGHLEACLNAKSCANHNFFYFSDLIVEGEYSDFPNLDLKANQWATIRIEVKEKNIKVLVNNQIIFKGPYTKSVGQVKGFYIKIQGFGSVDYFKAWDKEGKLIENEEFN